MHDNSENIEGAPRNTCLCGRVGGTRFLKTENGYLCRRHLRFWLYHKTNRLLKGIKKDDDLIVMIHLDGKKK